jgi:uncharacterized protein YukE
MPDEHYQRYNRYTHDQLYRQLHQGSPILLARQADAWRRAAETAATTATKLRRDLNRLATRWTGQGSDEFGRRISLIAAHAQELADEAASIGVGTEAMSRALAEAQRQAEPNPVGTEMVSDPVALRATLLRAATHGTTPEAVLGSSSGHLPPPEEQAAAYRRMVALVAELAVLYGLVDRANWPATIRTAPAGMPGDTPVAAEPTTTTTEPTGGLAGAGPLMPGPLSGGAGVVVPTGPVPGAAASTPVMLAGAAPGLASASGRSVNPTAVGTTTTGAPVGGGGPGGAPGPRDCWRGGGVGAPNPPRAGGPA